jgi:protein-disulfide isomerase
MVNANVVWALVSGLAVGYIFGNALPITGGSSSSSSASHGADSISSVPGDKPGEAVPRTTGEAPMPPPPKWYKVPLAPWTPILGPKEAKVTIVAFSDFECSFCATVEPALKQVSEAYGNDVRIAWRNAPAPFHPEAVVAAEAAMAANAQGKFWPMHDKLFANQSALDRASLDRYAKEVGLEMTKYMADMASHAYASKIDADTKLAVTAGLNGTPTFFINGQYVFGAQPFEELKKVIDIELAKANALLAAGTKLDKLYEAELDALPAPGTVEGEH